MRHPLAYYTFCATLAIATLALVYLSWQEMRVGAPVVTPVAHPSPATDVPRDVDSRPSLGGLFHGDGFQPTALIHDADSAALASMPADLPEPESSRGVRQWGFERTGSGQVEQVVAWQVRDVSIDQLAARYIAAAEARGFTRLDGEAGEGDAGAARVFTLIASDADGDLDPGAPASGSPRVLTIRLAPATEAEAVHLLVALRYAMAQP